MPMRLTSTMVAGVGPQKSFIAATNSPRSGRGVDADATLLGAGDGGGGPDDAGLLYVRTGSPAG